MRFVWMDFDDANFERPFFFLRTSIADVLRISTATPTFFFTLRFSNIFRGSKKLLGKNHQMDISKIIKPGCWVDANYPWSLLLKLSRRRSPKYFPLLVERILNQLASIFDRNPLLVTYYFWEVSADTQVPTESNIARLPIGTLFFVPRLEKDGSWKGRRELDGMFRGKKAVERLEMGLQK